MHRDIEPCASSQELGVDTGRSVVSVIGIDEYVAWPRLHNAVNDARGAARMFMQLGFAQVASPLLDGAATGEAMRRLLTDHLAKLAPEDSLVVFFAGHGHTHTAGFGDVTVKTGYLIPVDAAGSSEHVAVDWLRLDSWLSDIARLPPRHILVIIDACHSGVALESLVKWRDAAPLPAGAMEGLQRRRSRRVITSALDSQRALDSGPYPGHSLFTGCLIEGLSGGLSRARPRFATGSEIGLYVQRRVSSYPGSKQTPDFGAFELDDRGEIVVPILGADATARESTLSREPSITGSPGQTEVRVLQPPTVSMAERSVDIPEPPEASGPATSAPAGPQHELLIELGRGGMGVVHLARRADGRLVVVKRLRPELARNVNVRRSFLEEARIAARIRHASVVEVLGTGFDPKGVPWLEMEWAPGVSLQALSDVAPLPWDLYVAVIAELLAGLHAAHTAVGEDGKALELVHRDVSPHNVLVTYQGHAKILDFGIAKVRDSTLQTTTGVVKGKATYLAPEQAAHGPVDARTDLFAVGVMLWQQIAERRLWEGVSEPEIFHRLILRDIPDLREAAPSVEQPVCRVVQRALAPDPDDRFGTADELRSALLEASPPRASATADIARHVRECFADQLHEIEQLVHSRDAMRNHEEETAGSATSLFGSRGNISRARRVWPVALAVAAVASAAIAVTVRCMGPAVPSEYAGCTTIAPEAQTGSPPLYLGAMFPLTGPGAEAYGRANANAAELAVREVNRLAGGVPATGGRRPLGLIVCDDVKDAAERARYLARRVPAVIGFGSTDEVLELMRDVFLPEGILVVSALNEGPVLAQMPAGNPRRFFRIAPNATLNAQAIAKAIETMLAPEARRREELRAGDRVRVAVVRSAGATGVAYAADVLRSLDRAPELNAAEIALGEPGATRAMALAKLVAIQPHVIVMLADDPFRALVAPLEHQLGEAENNRPLYIGGTPWEGEDFQAFITEKPERRARFFAISWPTASRALRSFVERYNESFHESVTPVTASPAPYDSVYLLAYAAAVAGADRAGLDGADLSQAIKKLGPGAPELAVGPTTVIEGLMKVGRGARIDLQGVLSRFDFDDATGDSPFDVVVLCTTYDDKTKRVDAADLAIAPGPVTCPDGVDTTGGSR